MAKAQPSRDDVAARAGVSPVTVSRCFSNPESVSPKRRQSILAVAEELGYHPNRGASVMRSNRTGRLALIERIPQEGREWEKNWQYDYLFKSTYHGVLRGLAESVYSFVYLPVQSNEELSRALAKTPMDGIIGMNFEFPEELEPILRSDIPYVISHHAKGLRGINRCFTDNYQGSHQAGAYLRDTGHRRVAYATYRASEIQTHKERLQGFRDGTGERNLVKVLDLQKRGKEGGALAGQILLDEWRQGIRYDAIGVLNDETAVPLAQVLMAGGIRIPEDVSMIGYDHNPIADFLPFSLATVNLNLETVYHIAVTSLLQTIRSGGAIDHGISPVLIRGNSVLTRT